MPDQSNDIKESKAEQKSGLEKRLDAIGWGLFLIMIGGLWLAPERMIPDRAWLIGTGIIIIGVSLAKYLHKLKVSGFWVFLGILAVGSGLSDLFALDLPVFPIILVIFGAGLILKTFLEKK